MSFTAKKQRSTAKMSLTVKKQRLTAKISFTAKMQRSTAKILQRSPELIDTSFQAPS